MATFQMHQQEHGYRNGHELLSATIKLDREDQDAIDRLSDISGSLRPDEIFTPYLTGYPLPSRTYFVLARTWQDLLAPRAGCVLTRSLLIPSDIWSRLTDLDEPLAHLATAPVTNQSLSSLASPISSLNDPRLIEIVESIFLERRQPVVVFEATEAESISIRVVTSLWPSLRANFSFCTFALSPRKILGKEFDLLFAPKSARSRFSAWEGRRIEIGGNSIPRHRWSQATTEAIFGTEGPNLQRLDSLGALERDQIGDESMLRLTLLWNELVAKSESSPTAVLGMLDILRSQPSASSAAHKKLLPLLLDATKNSTNALTPGETWKFLKALASKLDPSISSDQLLTALRNASSTNTIRDPESAILSISELPEVDPLPEILLSGVGDGIAEVKYPISNSIGDIPTSTVLDLLSISPKFEKFVVMESSSEIDVRDQLVASISSTPEIDHGLRLSMLGLIKSKEQTPLLAALLSNTTKDQLIEAVEVIGRTTNFENEMFDTAVRLETNRTQAKEAVRQLLFSNFNTAGADRILLSLLSPNSADMRWIASQSEQRDRAHTLLLNIIDGSTEAELAKARLSRTDTASTALLLSSDLPRCADAIEKILSCGEPSFELLQSYSMTLPGALRSRSKARFQRMYVRRCFIDGPNDNKFISAAISEFGESLTPNEIVEMATASSVPPEKLSENIIALSTAQTSPKRMLSSCVDELTDLLIRRNATSMTERAYISWASLIEQARKSPEKIKAATSALSFAYACKDKPVSALVLVSFPAVYAKIMSLKKDSKPSFFSTMLTLPFAFFLETDRPSAMKEQLIDVFMRSTWPPANLMITASNAGVENAIMASLSRKTSGVAYIDKMKRDLPRIESPLREKIGRIIAG